MARHVQDREDLLREATALLPRVSLKVNHPEIGGEVFLGFRGDALSVYFNAEPVFHFNPAGELRRAFYKGHILKSEQGEIVRWDTQRTDDTTVQVSTGLDAAETASLREDLLRRLELLEEVIDDRSFELLGEVPADGDVLARWCRWRREWTGFRVASTPRVR